jgi:large repetitive protein
MLRVGFRAAVASCAAAAGLCAVPAISSAKTVKSTFNKNLQSWRVIGDPATGSPAWVSTGGNPGGYLSAVDGGQGQDMVAMAPKGFLGKKGAFYGGSLTFDRKIEDTSGGAYFTPPWTVQLVGDGGTVVDFTLATPPGPGWTRQQIALLPQDTSNGVSAATLQAVLGSLQSIGIEIEYISGTETDDLDNVVLATPSKPTITAAAKEPFTVGTAGSYTIKTTGSPFPALTESGALPSGLTFTDNGDGTATIAGTPAAGSAGSYPVTVTATNGTGTAQKAVKITVS